jgi:hypothetical protein
LARRGREEEGGEEEEEYGGHGSGGSGGHRLLAGSRVVCSTGRWMQKRCHVTKPRMWGL